MSEGNLRRVETAATTSSAPWLHGWEPRPGRLARARLSSKFDHAAIERFRPRDLLPAPTIFECVRAAADHDPDKQAMVLLASADLRQPPQSLTYSELLSTLTRAANLFHHVAGGERPSVAIVLPMVPESLICTYAAATCGVATTINPFLELHHAIGLLRASAANIVVTTNDEIWAKLSQAKDEVPSLQHVFFVGADDSAWSLSAAMRRAGDKGLDFSPTGPEDAVVHMPTGGTTAAPKLARLNQMALLTVAWSVGALMGPTENGVVGHAMPNFHIGGMGAVGLRTLLYGQTLLTLTRDGFRNRGIVENFWDIARHYKMTSVLATPTTAAAIMANQSARAEGHCLTDFHCGGSTVPTALMSGFHARFGVWLRENWGMTEAHGTMTGHPNDGCEPVIGSVGTALPFFQAKAVKVDDRNAYVRDCAPGERGVLALGGPTIMGGYVDSSLDADYFITGMPDGARWGNTGDVGTVDEAGNVWLFGRRKDVIIRGGHNIDPKPVEEAIAEFPGVHLVAVVGRPDPSKGELPVAYVQPSAGAKVDIPALLEFCAERVHERAAIPVEVILLDQLPLTAVGKILKPALAEDIFRRVVEGVVVREVGASARFRVAVDRTGRRPKAEVTFPEEGLDEATRVRVEAALGGFEFDSEVRAVTWGPGVKRTKAGRKGSGRRPPAFAIR
jgi:fatty-acyl-CoA synthase